MAYKLHYSDYPGTDTGPPDPAAWVGPPGPPGADSTVPGPAGPTYTLPTSSTTILGGVKIDGTTVAISSGVISAVARNGTTTNDNALAGQVGEFIQSIIAVGSGPTNTTAGGVQNITNISLTAGDWHVWGVLGLHPLSGASFGGVGAAISTVSVTFPSATTGTVQTGWVPGATAWASEVILPVPQVRMSLATTTTVYLVEFAQIATGTAQAYGSLMARRVR